MQDDQLLVPGRNDVLLQVVSAHRVSEGFRRQGVLWQVTAGSPMCDDLHIIFNIK